MTNRAEHSCHHCGISFGWNPLETRTEDDTTQLFCCRGCQGAFRLVCAAGLGGFYSRDDRALPTVSGATSAPYRDDDLNRHVAADGEYCRLDILVCGISCPSCIWLLERMIARVSGVAEVSISYAGGIASVRFDPALTLPSAIFESISGLGFLPRPYTPALSDREARRERNDLLLRFGTALFLTMQLMAYSYSLYAGYFQGMSPAIKSILQYASLLVATPVVFYCGWPFLAGAWQSLRARSPGMDLLIAVGALAAWIYSAWALAVGRETYFESAAMIVTFVLVGRLLELSVRRTALSGIEALYAAASQRATLLEQGGHRDVPAADVRPGDRLLVRQGERFPVDCLVLEGETEVDQSLVTGESVPVLVQPDSEIRAGCVNIAAPIQVQALRPVGHSYLMRVAALVRMAQAGKPALQRLADRIAGWFVPAVILLAVLVFAGQYVAVGQGFGPALMVSLSVVLIACPCAMGLAVPAAVLAACSRSAALGIILRSGEVIERLAAVQSVFFDKTGTITMGQPQVISFCTFNGLDELEVLSAAASAEQPAAHPLARAIVAFAAEIGLLPGECRGFAITPGKGIRGETEGSRRILCGSAAFLEEQGVPLSGRDDREIAGDTEVLVVIDGRLAGRFLLCDQLRPGAEELVSSLISRGLDLMLVSGDAQPVVDRIAAAIGMGRALGNMTPDRKLELVQSTQAEGRIVLMAGDGVNDAPALAAADVSCSLTGSCDIALENADIIITGDDLRRLATAHRIACTTMSVIRQNLAWAFLYNIIGIPLAMFGVLTPVYAAVAMTASSLLVSLNSLRLMRIKHHG
ncbi:MAG: heavy metal translocating P-type ATPase metal-binding domain-containing protein [Desulfuromonadales bacterium]|nr:heavy metal translocating P-type ATPase metal-binding domain-containing protein [Desulfuromonadales bacterium]